METWITEEVLTGIKFENFNLYHLMEAIYLTMQQHEEENERRMGSIPERERPFFGEYLAKMDEVADGIANAILINTIMCYANENLDDGQLKGIFDQLENVGVIEREKGGQEQV